MRDRLSVLLLIVAVAAAACAGDATTAASDTQADPTSAAPAATEPATEPGDDSAGGAALTVDTSDLGDILVDGDGATLYLFLNDDQGASTCYDDCEQNWPPLTAPVEADDGIDESLLGTVEREDGTEQVTYNDWPLYYFAGDAAAGDTAGQGVGDVWFVVDTAGEPVRQAAANESGAGY